MFRIRSENIDKRHKRLALLALALLFVACCGLHFYSRYKMKQALSLLTEATAIKVGDGEQSVISLVARYGGSRSASSPGAYSYEIKLSPFQVFSMDGGERSPFRSTLVFIMSHVPNYLREPLGLRDWLVAVDLSIQNGQVTTVSSNAMVEGRSRWLGNSWKQTSEAVGLDGAPSAYSVDMAYLTFAPRGGSTLEEVLPPLASFEQVRASYEINHRCFTSLIPCASLCDLKPSIFRYLYAHPEVRVNFEIDRCRLPQSSDPK